MARGRDRRTAPPVGPKELERHSGAEPLEQRAGRRAIAPNGLMRLSRVRFAPDNTLDAAGRQLLQRLRHEVERDHDASDRRTIFTAQPHGTRDRVDRLDRSKNLAEIPKDILIRRQDVSETRCGECPCRGFRFEGPGKRSHEPSPRRQPTATATVSHCAFKHHQEWPDSVGSGRQDAIPGLPARMEVRSPQEREHAAPRQDSRSPGTVRGQVWCSELRIGSSQAVSGSLPYPVFSLLCGRLVDPALSRRSRINRAVQRMRGLQLSQ